jgi:peptidoglycan hydrolase CwlO-like protein
MPEQDVLAKPVPAPVVAPTVAPPAPASPEECDSAITGAQSRVSDIQKQMDDLHAKISTFTSGLDEDKNKLNALIMQHNGALKEIDGFKKLKAKLKNP